MVLSYQQRSNSKHNVEDLLTQVAGRLFRRFSLLDKGDALKITCNCQSTFAKTSCTSTHRNKVHFMGPPKGRAHVQSPADPEGKEDWDVDVRGEEVLRIPREEDLVAVDEDED